MGRCAAAEARGAAARGSGGAPPPERLRVGPRRRRRPTRGFVGPSAVGRVPRWTCWRRILVAWRRWVGGRVLSAVPPGDVATVPSSSAHYGHSGVVGGGWGLAIALNPTDLLTSSLLVPLPPPPPRSSTSSSRWSAGLALQVPGGGGARPGATPCVGSGRGTWPPRPGRGGAPRRYGPVPQSPAVAARRNSDLEEKDAKSALRSSQKSCNQTKMQGRNSNPQQKCEAKKGIGPRSETHNSLKKEILKLEMHLKDQQVVRGALEKALGPGPAPVTLQNESPMLKPATQLIWEVAALVLEIKHLEQYLLTLYRKAFEQQQQQLPSSEAHNHREAAPKLSSVSSRSSQQLDETPKMTKEPFQGGGASSRFVTQGRRP